MDSWVQSSKGFSLAAAVSDKLHGERINETAFIFPTEGPPKRLFVSELAGQLRKRGPGSQPRLGGCAKGQICLAGLTELRPLAGREPGGYGSRSPTQALSRGQAGGTRRLLKPEPPWWGPLPLAAFHLRCWREQVPAAKCTS